MTQMTQEMQNMWHATTTHGAELGDITRARTRAIEMTEAETGKARPVRASGPHLEPVWTRDTAWLYVAIEMEPGRGYVAAFDDMGFVDWI